jgi:2'-5' RNA ligase
MVEGDLAIEVDGLRRGLGANRRRVAPHLTLVSPMNVREDALPDALAVLQAAAAEVGPFDLDIGPAATFHPANPVVYLAVRGELDALRRLRDAVRVAPLDRRAEHEFVAHVTIGEGLPPERIEAAAAALGDFDARWPVHSVTLLEDQAPGPRRWNPIAEARLGDGGRPWEPRV